MTGKPAMRYETSRATKNRVLERQLTRRDMKELLRESEEGMLLKN